MHLYSHTQSTGIVKVGFRHTQFKEVKVSLFGGRSVLIQIPSAHMY